MVKILSLNVGGNCTHFAGLYGFIGRYWPDCVCLQELRSNTEFLQAFFSGLGFTAFVSLDPSTKLGVGLLWRGMGDPDIDVVVTGRLLVARFPVLNIVNIYAPSGKFRANERREFFGCDLVSFLRRETGVIIGDWNCVVESRETQAEFRLKFCPILKEVLSVFSLKECWFLLHPDQVMFSWHRKGAFASRLDRAYVPATLQDNVKKIEYCASLSDHHVLFLSLDLSGFSIKKSLTGPCSFWRFNSALLREENFRKGVCSLMESLQEERAAFDDVADFWDLCVKNELAEYCKSYASRRARGRKTTLSFLYNQLEFAVEICDWSAVGRLRGRIKDMLLEDSMGLVVRSKDAVISEEEVGVFHAHKESLRGNKNVISDLDVDDNIINDPAEIKDKILSFYSSLLSGSMNNDGVSGNVFNQDITDHSYFLEELPVISDESREAVQAEITVDEIEDALASAPEEKSPGIDGFNYEFFLAFLPIFGSLLREVFMCVLKRGRLSSSLAFS